jgi:hypothetical protein
MKKVLLTVLFALALPFAAFAQELPDSVMVHDTVADSVQVFDAVADSVLVVPEVPDTVYIAPPAAQEVPLVTDETPVPFKKNEIGVSFTLGSGLQIAGMTAGVLASTFGTLFSKNDLYIAVPFLVPSLAIEYDRWISDKIAVGISLNADIVSGLPYLLVGNISIMPDVKFNWYDSKNIKLYSKLAAGYLKTVCVSIEDGKAVFEDIPVTFPTSITDVLSTLSMWSIIPPMGFQLSPLGVDIKAKKLAFYLEIGTGTQGGATFGLKKSF